MMVFGNVGEGSGTGVAFTRDPASGARVSTGTTCRTRRARTWWLVSATPRRCLHWARRIRSPYQQLLDIMDQLEHHYRDLCDIEFTVERRNRGCCRRGWESAPLRRRSGSRVQLVDEGVIEMDEAVRRVTGGQLAMLMFPRFGTAEGLRHLATGWGLPGAASAASSSSPRPRVRRAGGRQRTSSWCGARPTRTTSPAWWRPSACSPVGRQDIARGCGRQGMGKTAVCGAESPWTWTSSDGP